MLNTLFGLISFTSRKPTFKKGDVLVSGIAGCHQRVSTFSYVVWSHIFPRKTRDFVNQFLPVQGLLSP